MNFDINTVPFSCYGSYLAFSYPRDGEGVYQDHLALRILYGMFNEQETYPIVMLNQEGVPVAGDIEATPVQLKVSAGGQGYQICFQNEDTVHLKGSTDIMITKTKMFGLMCDRVMHHETGSWEIAGNDASVIMEMIRGSISDDSVWSEEGTRCENIKVLIHPDKTGEFEMKLTLAGLSYRKPQNLTYEQNLLNVETAFEDFKKHFHTGIEKYKDSMELAAYISWHSVVRPEGYVKYPVMLMTKNKMNMVWSWDYTFNALAMMDKDPVLAYDQFLAIAEMQEKDGSYPDAFHARAYVCTFVKPPVQGFILKRMFKIQRPGMDILRKIYDSVVRFTKWWFDYRGNIDGIPVYHHGNDSGWDNSTAFRLGVPVKAPDLSAWLIIQLDFLADTALELGLIEEADVWKKKSEELLQKMLALFVENNHMKAIKVPDNKTVECDSLLLYVPLILGEKLPAEIRERMLEELLKEKNFITDYGIASEPVDSPYFVEDGYWRGAIWPPTAYIMTEALMANGRKEEAVLNARRFCDMCASEGFFENYSAIDGHGLRDSGFTWTASVFMILIRDYLEK